MKTKHMLLMMLCCAIPLALIFVLPRMNLSLGGLGFFLIVLLCPLMHFLLMRGAHGTHGAHHSDAETGGSGKLIEERGAKGEGDVPIS